MKREIRIGAKQIFTCTQNDYVASGGQASIYKHGNLAYKIYHDLNHSLPLGKIKELSSIQCLSVIKPIDPIFDAKTNDAIGYSMKFLPQVESLCKYFTKGFKNDHNIGNKTINELVKNLQVIVGDIHKDKCLVVDLNELNVLVENHNIPLMIDTDSYQTPSYPATAIMASVRDRRTKGFSELTDWFSFGVLACQLYINIHPYKGRHPKYKPNEMEKRMEDGVSIWDKDVNLPPVCNDFSVIPKRHLDWLEAVFKRNERSEPPLPDSVAPVQPPKQIKIVKSDGKFKVIEVYTFPDKIVFWHNCLGLNYFVTEKHIFKEDKELPVWNNHKLKEPRVINLPDGTLIVSSKSGENIEFFDLLSGAKIGNSKGEGYFSRNGAFYIKGQSKLIEYGFVKLGVKILPKIKDVQNISSLSSLVFDGLVIQDLLGKKWLSLPYGLGRCLSKPIPDLDGYRILEAKNVRNICVVLGEKNGKYDRFILTFNKDFTEYKVRKDGDVGFDSINFTVLDNGLVILLLNDTELEINNGNPNIYNNPPFDSSMKLNCVDKDVYFVDNNSIFGIKV